MSKRGSQRIYLLEDVSKHDSARDCWVIRKNKIYDVSSFVSDHPGGDDLILRYAGKDMDAVMEDAGEHVHSEAAYDLLQEFQVGVLSTAECIVDENLVIDDDFHPEDTDKASDYRKNQFLDLDRPLIMQVWHANFSKSFYLQQVHQPRHLPQPARLFGPWYLEMFTRTPWYIVPLFWLPIAATFFYKSLSYQLNTLESSLPSALATTISAFLFGNLFWTFIEYVMHRFVFHVDELLPDHRLALLLHFLLHGIHHYLPMDRLRLVMPPILFAALEYPFTRLAHAIFPAYFANGAIAGAFVFYVLYDCMHYALHHTRMPQYMKEMKVYHMAHHFKNFDLGFGVTSKIWDKVFRTELMQL